MRKTVLGVVVLGFMLAGCGGGRRGLVPEVRQLDAYANAHDAAGFTGLLSDDVVFKAPDGSEHAGKDSVRAYLTSIFPGFHVDSYDYRPSGDTVKWKSAITSEAFTRLGLGLIKTNTEAVFSGDKVKYFSAVFDKETVNKLRFLQFYSVVVNGKNVDSIGNFLTDDFVDHSPAPPNFPQGAAGVKQFFQMMLAAFPDLHVTPTLNLAEGDYAAIVSTWEGTNKGKFMGMRATNKRLTWTGCDIIRIFNGKAAEHWGWDDMAERMSMPGGGVTPPKASTSIPTTP